MSGRGCNFAGSFVTPEDIYYLYHPKNEGAEQLKLNLAPFFQFQTACKVLFLSFFNQTIIGRLELR